MFLLSTNVIPPILLVLCGILAMLFHWCFFMLTEYHCFVKWQLIFYVSCRCFISSITSKSLTDLIWVAWRGLIRNKNRLPFASTWVHLRILVGSALLILFSFLCSAFLCVLFVFFLCLLNPMLAMPQDCPFLIAASVCTNVFFLSLRSILYINQLENKHKIR